MAINAILNSIKYYFIIGLSITIFMCVVFCGVVIFARDNERFSKSIDAFTNKTVMQKTKEIFDYVFMWPLVVVVLIMSAISGFKSGWNRAQK